MAQKILNISGLKDIVGDFPIKSPYDGSGLKGTSLCPTYSMLTSGTICQYANVRANKEGINVKSYSVGDSSTSYSDTQLVCEMDVEMIRYFELRIQGNIEGYKISVNNEYGWSDEVTATTTSVTFNVVPGNYSYKIERDDEYGIVLNPTSDTIPNTSTNYTPNVSATTIKYSVLTEQFVVSENPTVLRVTTSSSTVDSNYVLTIVEGGAIGSVSGKNIVFNEPNLTSVGKTIKYKVIHANDSNLTQNGEITQTAIQECVLTVTSNMGGTVTVEGYGSKTLDAENKAEFSVATNSSLKVTRNTPENKYSETSERKIVATPTVINWSANETNVEKTFSASTYEKTPYTSYTTPVKIVNVETSNISVDVNVTETANEGEWEEVTGITVYVDNSTSDYVDLGLPSGTMWMKYNIGANSETEYGLLFQWGATEGHDYNTDAKDYSTWSTTPYYSGSSNDNYRTDVYPPATTLATTDDAAYIATNGAARMPTQAELEELTANTNVEWVTNFNGSGVNGRKFTNKTDEAKYIFIPASDSAYDGSVYGRGSYGNVWSSSLNADNPDNAWNLYFNSSYVGVSSSFRCSCYSVRGVVSKN